MEALPVTLEAEIATLGLGRHDARGPRRGRRDGTREKDGETGRAKNPELPQEQIPLAGESRGIERERNFATRTEDVRPVRGNITKSGTVSGRWPFNHVTGSRNATAAYSTLDVWSSCRQAEYPLVYDPPRACKSSHSCIICRRGSATQSEKLAKDRLAAKEWRDKVRTLEKRR